MFLVTGGAGFIGGHLLRRLSALGIPARCLRRSMREKKPLPHGRGSETTAHDRDTANHNRHSEPSRDRQGAVSSLAIPPGVETVEADWATGRGLEAAIEGVGTVIHLAGATKALKPADYYTGNARATETLARLLAGRPIRLVHVSSLAAMGPSPDGEPLDEDATPHPISHYGKSKLEAERLARHWCPDAVVVRPPVVYGPRDTDVFQLLKSIAHGVVLELSGGERWFSAIYVEDLVDGLLAAAEAPQAAGRAYFLTHPKPLSWTGLAAVAARLMNRRPRVVRLPPSVARAAACCAEGWSRITRRPGILSRDKVTEACCRAWTCDSRRAARELGFSAATPLEAGLARTLAWYKEAGWISY